MAHHIEDRLQALGIELPQPSAPGANYVPAVRTGDLIFITGQLSQWNGERRFIGKLVADRTLEIHSTATIKGNLSGAGRLVVPAGNHFRWQEALRVVGAEIAGELVATLHSAGTVLLKSSARLFGDVQAANLIVESGAIFVGAVRVGRVA